MNGAMALSLRDDCRHVQKGEHPGLAGTCWLFGVLVWLFVGVDEMFDVCEVMMCDVRCGR